MTNDFDQERQRILAEMEARTHAGGQPMNLKEWLKVVESATPPTETAASGAKGGTTDPLGGAASARASRRARRRARRAEKSASRTRSADPTLDALLQEDVVKFAESTSVGASSTVRPSAAMEGNMSASGAPPASGNKGLIIFSTAIGLTLTMALGGVGYLGYQKISEQLAVLQQNDRKTSERIDKLQSKLEQLEKSPQRQMSPAYISQSMDEKGERNGSARMVGVPLDVLSERLRQQLQEAGVVTEMLLNTRLNQVQRQLTQTIDKRFATLLAQIRALQKHGSHGAQSQKDRKEKGASAQAEVGALAAPVTTPDLPVPPVKPKVAPPAVPAQAHARPRPSAKPAEMDAVDRSPDKKSSPKLTASERWLAQQSGQDFTLQLASVRDRKSLEEMRALYGLEKAKIVRHIKNGRIYYLLIIGLYKSKEAAFQAADAMKKRTGSMPWIRRIRALQRQLPQ